VTILRENPKRTEGSALALRDSSRPKSELVHSLSPPIPDQLPVVVEKIDNLVGLFDEIRRQQSSLVAVLDFHLFLINVRSS